jgi:preprotein translocase subunit SecG
MSSQSILHRTLWLFAGAFAAAVLVLVALIWWAMRRGAPQI